MEFKKFLHTIWAVWVAIVFIATAILVFIAFLIVFNLFKGRKAFNAGMLVSETWSATFMYCIGMPVKAHNKQVMRKDQAYVLISNHFSQLDIPAALTVAPQHYRFLSKKEVEKIPVVSYPLKKLHLLVNRKSKESRAKSIKQMKDSLKEGISIIIFCEGTRNPGPDLTKDFYDGGFKVAVESKTPIVVQTIVETWDRQNAHMGFKFSPGPINIYFDGPIDTSGMTEKDIPKLKEQVRGIMHSHIGKKYGHQLPMRYSS